MGRHGGGAFSGKDPTKVDRSAAYMGRWVAKNVVAAKLAAKCEVQFAYAIGHPDPVSVHVETFGTATGVGREDHPRHQQVFNFQPADIIEQLKLRRPIYSKTTNYGHFGKNDKDLTWEATTRCGAAEGHLSSPNLRSDLGRASRASAGEALHPYRWTLGQRVLLAHPLGDDAHTLHSRTLPRIHHRDDIAIAQRTGPRDVERLVTAAGEDLAQT